MLSIIIPALDEEDRIGAQLGALAAQAAGLECEVLVADNGSRDRTVEVVRSWSDRLAVRVVDASARPGQAAARNIAAASAHGDLLVFVDADDVVMPGFLGAWSALPPEVGFGTGPLVFFAAGAVPSPAEVGHGASPPVQLAFLPYALGANLGVRRDWFERVGGFDESYPPAEDVELSWRLQLAGADLVWVRGAAIAKREVSGFRAMVRQYYRYGARDPFLYRDYRAAGVPPPAWRATARSYAGIVARVPLLGRASVRRRWAHQLGRRAGRLVGSVRAGVWYP